MIEISKVRIDGGTQSRAMIHEDTVAEYAEAMSDPETVFPPIIVYFDGRDHWLADGFHRLEAWRRIGRVEVPAEVRQGDRRRAILHSVAANTTHGLRRTNDDKRRAVMTLLEDDEWSQWSNREIARRCGVSHQFVNSLRDEVSGNGCQIATERKVERGGTTYTLDTSKIGKTKPPEPAPSVLPAEGDGRQEGGGNLPPADQTDNEDHDPVHAEKLDAEPDPHEAVRKSLRALTREGLEDEIIGLREENRDLRKRVKKQTGEIADLKARIKDFEGDEAEVIRALQKKVEVAGNARWKAEEDLTAWKRKHHALEKRVKELEQMGVVTL